MTIIGDGTAIFAGGRLVRESPDVLAMIQRIDLATGNIVWFNSYLDGD